MSRYFTPKGHLIFNRVAKSPLLAFCSSESEKRGFHFPHEDCCYIAKVLTGLSLYGNQKAWFLVSSRIDDTEIGHRSGRRSQAHWLLIRAPFAGALITFFEIISRPT
jgi:hypothetical protein